MKLGIYPGSFNPPHLGHKKIIDYLLINRIVDKIIIIPTMNYWNKTNLSNIDDRINMLKFYESDLVIIDKENNHYQYTIDLMKKLGKEYKDDELFLIIGADNIIDFDKWKDYKKLLKYKIIIMNRNNINIKKYLYKYPNNNFIIIEDFHYIDISSSEIRNNLNNKYLDENILNYIKSNGLYK